MQNDIIKWVDKLIVTVELYTYMHIYVNYNNLILKIIINCIK